MLGVGAWAALPLVSRGHGERERAAAGVKLSPAAGTHMPSGACACWEDWAGACWEWCAEACAVRLLPLGLGLQGVQRYRWYQRRRVERHAVNASCS